MKKHEIDDEKYKKLKKKAKTFGIIALSIGLVLDVIGFISFFAAFINHGFPYLFPLLVIGFPLTGLGLYLLIASSIGTIFGYYSSQTAPIAKDVANYMIKGTREEIRNTFDEIDDNKKTLVCPKCGSRNDYDSSFCSKCGTKLVEEKKICSYCGEENEGDALFCNRCGRMLDK